MSKGSNTTRSGSAATTRSSQTNGGGKFNISKTIDRILNNDSLSDKRFVTVKAPDGIVQVEHYPRRYGGGIIVIHTSPTHFSSSEKEITYKGDMESAKKKLESALKYSIQRLGGKV